MMERERQELASCRDLKLIYPLLSYEHEFKIDELFNHYYNKIRLQIESGKKQAVQKKEAYDVYEQVFYRIKKGNVPDYCFKLEVENRRDVEEEPETPEE